jgi:hypothetical protein
MQLRYIAFCLVARERKVPPAPAETPKIHLLPSAAGTVRPQ